MKGDKAKKVTSHPAKFSLSLLHPRYLLSWLIIAAIWLIHWLPRCWILALGAKLGNLYGKKNHKRRQIVAINLKLCFPELGQHQRAQLMQQHFQRYGQNFLELGQIWWAPPDRLKRLISISGDAASLKCAHQGGAKLYLTPHVVGMELGGLRLSLEHEGVAMMKSDRNPLNNWWLHKSRMRLPNSSIITRDQGLRPIIRAFKEGKFFYYIPDGDFGEGKHSVYAKFFGIPRSTLNTVSRLAKLTNTPVIPCMTMLDPKSGLYNLVLAPQLKNFPSDDMIRDATMVNQAFESLIRNAPDQYLWAHRWFESQPNGAPSPYPKV